MPKQTTVPKTPEESMYELFAGMLVLLKQLQADLPKGRTPAQARQVDATMRGGPS